MQLIIPITQQHLTPNASNALDIFQQPPSKRRRLDFTSIAPFTFGNLRNRNNFTMVDEVSSAIKNNHIPFSFGKLRNRNHFTMVDEVSEAIKKKNIPFTFESLCNKDNISLIPESNKSIATTNDHSLYSNGMASHDKSTNLIGVKNQSNSQSSTQGESSSHYETSNSQSSTQRESSSYHETSTSQSYNSTASTTESRYRGIHKNVNRIRMKNKRANETQQQRSSRLHRDKIRHRNARKLKEFRQKESKKNKIYMKKKRKGLTNEERLVMNRQSAMNKAKERSKPKNTQRFRMGEEGLDSWDSTNVKLLYLGQATTICPYCGALYWAKETEYVGKNTDDKFSLCCSKGKFKLHELPDPPKVLRQLYEGSTTEDKYFQRHIRQLNCALAMAWLKCKQIKFKTGVSVFKINGQIHNTAVQVTPEAGRNHAFGQIYVLDPDLQTEERAKLNGICGKEGQYKHQAQKVLSKLQKMLMKENHLIQCYRNAFSTAKKQNIPEVTIVLQKDVKNVATRTYNIPKVDELAMVIPVGIEPGVTEREIILGFKSGGTQIINETNPLYEAFAYPLLYYKATPSWPTGVSSGNSMYFFNVYVIIIWMIYVYIYRKSINVGLLFI